MPRVCTICPHPQREAIDAALVAGDSLKRTAAIFCVSADALRRHKKNHLPRTLTQAKAAAEVANGDDLLSQLDHLKADAHRIGAQAEAGGDFRTALIGVRELVRIIELMAKIQGQIQEAPINILIMPEWVTVRAALIGALAPFPEARAAAARVLQGLDGGQPGR